MTKDDVLKECRTGQQKSITIRVFDKATEPAISAIGRANTTSFDIRPPESFESSVWQDAWSDVNQSVPYELVTNIPQTEIPSVLAVDDVGSSNSSVTSE